ncbi:uncharacterized protein LOC135398799 isoform X3 [Ornithodoros turicata]|uniref:uncharacterized protein LOC135398799 isoform X3 n=1 Tax=Ornithodoros turicata TaxID=34597 RepID=UPI00313995CA
MCELPCLCFGRKICNIIYAAMSFVRQLLLLYMFSRPKAQLDVDIKFVASTIICIHCVMAAVLFVGVYWSRRRFLITYLRYLIANAVVDVVVLYWVAFRMQEQVFKGSGHFDDTKREVGINASIELKSPVTKARYTAYLGFEIVACGVLYLWVDSYYDLLLPKPAPKPLEDQEVIVAGSSQKLLKAKQ